MSEDADIDAMQKDLSKDLKQSLGELGPAIMGSKIEQHKLLTASAAQGGPTSVNTGVQAVLDYLNIGIRPLSVKTKIPRKKLLGMIRGEMDMSAEVMTRIWSAIDQMRPGQLDRLKNMKHED